MANMLEKACWPSCRHDVDENEKDGLFTQRFGRGRE